jgi:hypothetical protein
MITFLEFDQRRKELEDIYVSKYFVFVGPHNLESLEERKLFDYYVYRQCQPEPQLLSGHEKYDIFFVDKAKLSLTKINDSIPYLKLSQINLAEL